VKAMSSDLDWTTALGEAVVADQGAVLEAIQVFRRRTDAAGNLRTDAKQTVVVEKEVIKIVPANPQVIYVPQYNPTTVIVAGGYSSWGYYPAPYPVYYYPYPPGAAFATGLIWGAALGAAWNGGRYYANYGGYGGSANININNSTNINTGNINRGNVNTGNINRGGSASTLPAGGSTQWKPSKQPGQVGGAGRPPSSRPGYSPAGGGYSPAASRPSTLPAGGASRNQVGARPSTQPAGGSAFNGYGSGRQAQMDSSRGQTSRNTMSSAGAGRGSYTGSGPRQVPPSGGVGQVGRAGGGGGTAGGGARRR